MKGDGFYQQMERLLPWIPRMFSKLAKKVESFDPREPVTMMAEIERDVNKVVQRVVDRFKSHPQLTLRAIRLLLNHRYFRTAMANAMQICIRKLEKQIASDPRAAQLMRLIDETDAEVPFRSWLVLQEHVDFHFLVRPLCLAGTVLEDARKLKGEAKATALIDAHGKTSEILYGRYLLALWQLTSLARGEWPTQPGFGSLVIELSRRLSEYPGLVDADARWMRNSARHERWEPIPGEEALIMWDDRTPRTRVTFSKLEKKVEDMYLMAGATFASIAHLYLFRTMLTETGAWAMVGKMLPVIFETADLDKWTDEAVEQQFESELRPLRDQFVPLTAFINSKAPGTAKKPVEAQ